jgi:hypothetical protein
MDALLALITFGAVVYFLVWKDLIEPLMKPRSVNHSGVRTAFKRRSRRSRSSNVVNAGSGQQNAAQPPVNVLNVQAAPAAPAAESSPGAPAGEGFTLTPRELQQLAEALAARATGSTVEEALVRGFGVKKGGSQGYRRAKELFDTATKAP